MTQPCQIQYIQYFQQFLMNPKCYPQVLFIKKLTFRGGFTFSDPYIKLVHMGSGKTVYNTREPEAALIVEKHREYSIVFNKKHCFVGDITLELKESRVVGKNLLISYVFNTAFLLCEK